MLIKNIKQIVLALLDDWSDEQGGRKTGREERESPSIEAVQEVLFGVKLNSPKCRLKRKLQVNWTRFYRKDL